MSHGKQISQPDLFGPAVRLGELILEAEREPAWQPHEHARTSDLGTSHAAAARARHGARAIMQQILAELAAGGPGTFSELAARTRRDEQQVWKRISDLKNAGAIEPTGQTRPGPSGRAQTVWRARS